MALIRKIRQIGNSLAIVIPNEIFDFLGFNPSCVKYKLSQDEKGFVYIIILDKDVTCIDEKKFQKTRNSFAVIIPKALLTMWNIGLSDGQKREIEISYTDSPLKWQISPV